MERFIEFPFGKDMLDILFAAILIKILIQKKNFTATEDEKKINKYVFLMIPLTYSALWVGSFKLGLPYPITLDNPQLALWKNFIRLQFLYFIAINTITNKKQIMIVIGIMVLTIFIMDQNFYQNQKWVGHESFSEDKRDVGVTFSYLGPNEFAAFYAQVTILFMGILLVIDRTFVKIVLWCLIMFNTYCILYLYSRGGYAAVLAGLLFLGLTKNRIVLLLLLILLVSWNTVLPDAVVERLEMTKTEEGVDASSSSRLELWSQALEEIIVNPLTGVGFGSSQYLGFKTSGEKSRRNVHNGYVEILLEQGIVGLTLFLYIFYLGIKKGWALYMSSKDNFLRGMGIGFVGMIIACLVSNLFGDRWSYLNVMGYFWILLGLVVKTNQINIEEEKAATL
ncbi:MAG: O-antigen ligase family protein [Nitrospirae bacterium]|nr:O-antigen ligase family protein [Nitrospirota bacterium]